MIEMKEFCYADVSRVLGMNETSVLRWVRRLAASGLLVRDVHYRKDWGGRVFLNEEGLHVLQAELSKKRDSRVL